MENNNEIKNVTTDEAVGTYVKIGDEDNGFLEFDLITYREKGSETRYISAIIHGFTIPDKEEDKSQPVRAQINIMSEEQFLAFKKFIQQLDWKA